MIFPCEHAVWHYLPQIRADLALGLVKSGMTQTQAAKKLGVTPAAVSQYIHKKRGMQSPKSVAYHAEIAATVEKICDRVSMDELLQLVCSCCRLMQKEGDEDGQLCSKAQQ